MDNELARIERLKGLENWGTWKFQVKILIQAPDALEIINGRIERPRPPTATGTGSAELLAEYRKNLKTWNILDSKAQKIIATMVSEQPLLHIMNCQSSKEMWDKLHEVFESKNETAKHILQQQ
ncbi:copia protein [Lasius niger]|uniref:Copia protein n=1 Tax=Lasius niger TaxID=67767 RepID=A0A0J7N0A5_LASNI|nr:copia protein [Lasius niger]